MRVGEDQSRRALALIGEPAELDKMFKYKL